MIPSFPCPVTLSETDLTEFQACRLFTVTCKHIFHSSVQNFWYSDWKISFLGGGRLFFDILAFESDLLLKDLRTFSQNLKQLWIVLIHVNIVFHSSWLCLGILAWGKCYHCQLDSNFMPTAQLLQISKKCCMLIPEDTFIRIKWMSLLLLFVVWLLFISFIYFF